MASFPVDKNRLQALVDRWNAQNPVNSTVIVKNYAEPKVTRSEAMVLFDRKAVIYLKDHNGYFDLEDVVPVENRGTEPSGERGLETGIRHSRAARSRECFIFPGQGSQEKGMGKQLFEAYPELTKVADHILGYSIENLCLADSCQVLDHTEYTQPALYVVNALSYLHEREIRGLEPGFLAGHSLGEYSALFAAGVFDFETGLRLVQKRGALMAEAKGGRMAAVIGMDAPQTMKVLSDNGLDSIDIANINSPQQTVISGARADVERARAVFESAGARAYIPLKVSGAFHSRYMKDFESAFREFLKPIRFQAPAAVVVSNVEASPYTVDKVATLLSAQLTSPVKWVDSIRYLEGLGVETFREVGPGTVLTGMVSRIRKGRKT